MEVHFAPELQAKIDQLVIETGRSADKLLEDAIAGYVADLVQTREMLNSRYDDLKSGRVKPVSSDEVMTHLRKKSARPTINAGFMTGCDFHPETALDLDETWNFIADDSLDAADRVIREILARIELHVLSGLSLSTNT